MADFTKGHSYDLTLRRPRSRPVTYSHVTYLGPDPARDGVAVFWWAEQVVVLKVEQAVVEDATDLSSADDHIVHDQTQSPERGWTPGQWMGVD